MTWVGSGEKEGESFHVCFSAAQCWRGTVAEQGSAWSASLFIYLVLKSADGSCFTLLGLISAAQTYEQCTICKPVAGPQQVTILLDYHTTINHKSLHTNHYRRQTLILFITPIQVKSKGKNDNNRRKCACSYI